MSETPIVTFSSLDNPNTWGVEGESKRLVFASPSEAKRAEELFTAMQRALTAERERAKRLMERLQQESERCDKEVSQRIWADTELQRERERADRLIAFLADDALAMTYQSLAQYRQAAIDSARKVTT